MNLKVMNLFLSEDNIKRHFDHLKNLRLKYSVFEKSVPEIKAMSIKEISKSGINRKLKEEALEMLWLIKSHELFFKSFSERPTWPEDIRKNNSSRERFIYDLLMETMDLKYGFIYVFVDKHNKLLTLKSEKFDYAFIKYEPILCLDLYEHAYFLDYGFDREKYVKNALIYFNTSKLCYIA